MCTWQSQAPRGTSKLTGVLTVFGAAAWAFPLRNASEAPAAALANNIVRRVAMAMFSPEYHVAMILRSIVRLRDRRDNPGEKAWWRDGGATSAERATGYVDPHP